MIANAMIMRILVLAGSVGFGSIGIFTLQGLN